MRDYFIRRLLLIPPTLLGVTIIVFAIGTTTAPTLCRSAILRINLLRFRAHFNCGV